MTVRIVTDSGCDLPPELDRELRAWDVQTIPFVFNFGLEACEDKSMSMQAFLARALKTWPTTAAPSVGACASAYQRIIAAGDQALCLTITGRHSGTYNAARLAAEDFPLDQVAVVDTRSLSTGEGLLALAAVQAARAGATLQEVVAILQDMIQRIHVFIGLDTLDFLVRGGRASRLVGAIASLLQLRPILSLEDGELTLREKPRSRARCKQRLLAMTAECLPAVALGVMHVAAADEAQELAVSLSSLSGVTLSAIPVVEVGMALATHAGPRGLGIVAISEPGTEAGPRGRLTIMGHELPHIAPPHINLPHIDLPHIGRDE